jgi:hypothetical protein
MTKRFKNVIVATGLLAALASPLLATNAYACGQYMCCIIIVCN